MNPNVLDLETASISGTLEDGYALEPWRARQGKAFISSLHYLGGDGRRVLIDRPNRQQLVEFLETIRGLEVWCWNTPFDVAWLIASIEPNKYASLPRAIADVRWRDGMLLTKWLLNGQAADRNFYSYSLANVCSDALRDEPGVEEFVAFKAGAPISSDSPYWQDRGILDCLWTQKLVRKIWPKLLTSQYVGFTIEAGCIATISNSQLLGINVDRSELQTLDDQIAVDDRRYVEELGTLLGRPFDASIVSSPKRMVQFLFTEMGFPVQKKTPTGSASTDVETLKLLHYALKMQGHSNVEVMERVMALKTNSTIRSKYIKTAWEALARTGEDCFYPIPRMFGTGSGRFTYSNETKKGLKVSIAAHQIPRRAKGVRAYMVGPNGEYISEWDASGQESRIMANWSQDPLMVDIFMTGKNFHTMTASGIVGIAYEDLQKMVDAEEHQAVEYRQMGKLGNLSCNYRIGGPALSKQAFVKYDMVINVPTSYQIINTFNKKYVGVPQFWDRAIAFSRGSGYATTAVDRRYKLDDWSKSWGPEQTAISHPIQGTGAEHKLIAVATVQRKVPEAKFFLDLHDASFFVVPNKECHEAVGEALNAIDYSQYWTQCPTNVPLPFEGKMGNSFKDVK